VADDHHFGLGVVGEAGGQLAQVVASGRLQLGRVEGEQDPRLERDRDAFAHPRDLGARDLLLQRLRLLVHAAADQRARRAADRGSDDRAAHRGARRVTHSRPDGAPGAGPDRRPLGGLVPARAPCENRCGGQRRRGA
jgi:hypothetical protein